MKKLTASVLGLDTFNEEKMDESLEKAVVNCKLNLNNYNQETHSIA